MKWSLPLGVQYAKILVKKPKKALEEVQRKQADAKRWVKKQGAMVDRTKNAICDAHDLWRNFKAKRKDLKSNLETLSQTL